MSQKLLNWYYSRELNNAKRDVRFYENYSADLAHEIFDLNRGSPILESIYESALSSLQEARNRLSKLQQKCEHNEPVQQSS